MAAHFCCANLRPPPPPQFYELNVRKLDEFWHRSALVAVLKLKARELLREVTREERIVYTACESGAKSVVDYAKCVVALMNFAHNDKLINYYDRDGVGGRDQRNDDVWSRTKRFWEEILRPLPALSSKSSSTLISTPSTISSPKSTSRPPRLFMPKSPSLSSKSRLLSVSASPILALSSTQLLSASTSPLSTSLSSATNDNNILQSSSAQIANDNLPKNDDLLENFSTSYDHLHKNQNWLKKLTWRWRRIRRNFPKPIPAKYSPENHRFRRDITLSQLSSPTNAFSFSSTPKHSPPTPLSGLGAGSLSESKNLTNLQNLRKLNHYLEIRTFCENFIKKLSDDNSRLIHKSLPINVDYRMEEEKNTTIFNEIYQLLNEFLMSEKLNGSKLFDWKKISILSPKVLPLLGPSKKKLNKILSPSILSFYEEPPGAGGGSDAAGGGSILSVPRLLKLIGAGDDFERDAWLDLTLAVSGAGAKLEDAMRRLAPDMDYVENRLLPAILELERLDANWQRMWDSMDDAQRHAIDTKGYAFLSAQQTRLIYDKTVISEMSEHLKESDKMSEKQRENELEQKIRNLASVDLKLREKRFAQRKIGIGNDEFGSVSWRCADQAENWRGKAANGNGGNHMPNSNLTSQLDVSAAQTMRSNFSHSNCTNHNPKQRQQQQQMHETKRHQQQEPQMQEHGGHGEEEELIEFKTLAPFAFASRVGKGVALEAMTLSPHAFFSEFVAPEALVSTVLSPRAFISSVLAPGALMARILSPAAFRAEILSPRALTSFVLSPEALIGEVLSPKALDARVLSPEFLIAKVLSPEFLAPKVLSPETVGVVVLSPHILSPHVFSGEKMMIEVISPSILSTSIEEESKEESKEKSKSDVHSAAHNAPHITSPLSQLSLPAAHHNSPTVTEARAHNIQNGAHDTQVFDPIPAT